MTLLAEGLTYVLLLHGVGMSLLLQIRVREKPRMPVLTFGLRNALSCKTTPCMAHAACTVRYEEESLDGLQGLRESPQACMPVWRSEERDNLTTMEKSYNAKTSTAACAALVHLAYHTPVEPLGSRRSMRIGLGKQVARQKWRT